MSEELVIYEPDGCQYCNGSMKELKSTYESEKAWGYVTYGTFEQLQSQLTLAKERITKLEEALKLIAYPPMKSELIDPSKGGGVAIMYVNQDYKNIAREALQSPPSQE